MRAGIHINYRFVILLRVVYFTVVPTGQNFGEKELSYETVRYYVSCCNVGSRLVGDMVVCAILAPRPPRT